MARLQRRKQPVGRLPSGAEDVKAYNTEDGEHLDSSCSQLWTRTHQDCPDVGVLCVVCAVFVRDRACAWYL